LTGLIAKPGAQQSRLIWIAQRLKIGRYVLGVCTIASTSHAPHPGVSVGLPWSPKNRISTDSGYLPEDR
jgi:hypothetical protein